MSESTETFTAVPAELTAKTHSLAKPTARQWLLHLTLFLVTLCTTTICGIWMVGDLDGAGLNQPVNGGGFLPALPVAYVATVLRIVRFDFLHPAVLSDGLRFSGSLLTCLMSHRSGHYH